MGLAWGVWNVMAGDDVATVGAMQGIVLVLLGDISKSKPGKKSLLPKQAGQIPHYMRANKPSCELY